MGLRDSARSWPELLVFVPNGGLPKVTDGVRLIVTSGYRSDAEQAELYKRHPDPKWVAPPGKSLHRWGTELDLGPPSRPRSARPP
jgi:LAS superfamily LD-carboxypeptidase LdcB